MLPFFGLKKQTFPAVDFGLPFGTIWTKKFNMGAM
jgi:hypothetical protein